MNIKEAKEELMDYREDMKYIEENMRTLEIARDNLYSISNVISDMPIYHDNSIPDKKAEAIASIADLSIEIANRIKKSQEKCKHILVKIDKIPRKFGNVLFCKYIAGNTFYEIGKKLGYTEDYAKELNGIALIHYAKIK